MLPSPIDLEEDDGSIPVFHERMQPDDLQPARQGLGQVREEQHVGGPREYKTARYPTAIHFNLDGFEQIRDTLYLVQDDALGQVGNETQTVGSRTVSHYGVVEADIRCSFDVAGTDPD